MSVYADLMSDNGWICRNKGGDHQDTTQVISSWKSVVDFRKYSLHLS